MSTVTAGAEALMTVRPPPAPRERAPAGNSDPANAPDTFSQALADADRADAAHADDKEPKPAAAAPDSPAAADPAATPATPTPPTNAAANPAPPPTTPDSMMWLVRGAHPQATLDAGATGTPKPTLPPITALQHSPKSVSVITDIAKIDAPARAPGAAAQTTAQQRLAAISAKSANAQAADGSATPAAMQRLAQQQDAPAVAMIKAEATLAAATPVMPAALEALAALAKRFERTSERDGPITGTITGAGNAVGNNPTASSALFAPVDAASAANAGGAVLADRMAEQVSWWLSNKSQNAELTLEVAGGKTVSVSVQVQGNEAQVAFRSDQPEVRQMLGQAAAELKDLFGNEGVLLSGVTVGTQTDAQGQAHPREGDGRREATSFGRGTIAVSEATPARVTAANPRGSAERTVDLYV